MKKRRIHTDECACKLCCLSRRALSEIDEMDGDDLPDDAEIIKLSETTKIMLLRGTGSGG